MEKPLSDYNLLRIALSVGIIGLAGLIVASLLTPQGEFLDQYNDEGKIKLEGEVLSVSAKGNFTSMRIKYECVVDTVIFEDKWKDDTGNSIFHGAKILVEGNLQEYKGKKSIIAEKIGLSRNNQDKGT